MRFLPLLLGLCTLISCAPDREHYPPGTTGPTGPGIGTHSPTSDGGIDPDGGTPLPDAGMTFSCAEETFSCEYTDGFANCCDDTFYECPTDFPFYCPSDTLCWFEEGLCVDDTSCSYTGRTCSP